MAQTIEPSALLLSDMPLSIPSAQSRKRIQNRLAQRRHRAKLKAVNTQGDEPALPSPTQSRDDALSSPRTNLSLLPMDDCWITEVVDGNSGLGQEFIPLRDNINSSLSILTPNGPSSIEQISMDSLAVIGVADNIFKQKTFPCEGSTNEGNFSESAGLWPASPIPTAAFAGASHLVGQTEQASPPRSWDTQTPGHRSYESPEFMQNKIHSQEASQGLPTSVAGPVEGACDAPLSCPSPLGHSTARMASSQGSSELMTDKFQSLLVIIKCLGFPSFDDMVCQYYKTEFHPDSMLFQAQQISRKQHLRKLLFHLRESSTSWPVNEMVPYRDEIFISAQGLYRSEIESAMSRLDAIRKLAGLIKSDGRQGGQSSTEEMSDLLDGEIYRLLRDALPTLWSLFTTLDEAANPSGAGSGMVGMALASLVRLPLRT